MHRHGGQALDHVAGRVRSWLDHALPFWIEHGIDDHGMFHEQLDQAGRPDLSAPRRVRVQARQLYVLARALLAGHGAAAGKLALGLATFEDRCRHPDGGWIHLLSPDGQAADSRRDLYDQAFVLFALAAVRQAGLARARALADLTLNFLDERLSEPTGGFREGLPDSAPRRSNPHMHLLEAFLAWHALTGEASFLDRANRIAALLADRFVDPADGSLGEFFDARLRRLPSPAGDPVEPGHHLEWSWLLHRLARAGGRDLRREAVTLHRWAIRHGLDDAGFAIDGCDRAGHQTRRSRRAWPQTELIKSCLANGEPEAAARSARALLDGYLAIPQAGLWIDQFAPSGSPVPGPVPASTLYHLVVAFEELLRVRAG